MEITSPNNPSRRRRNNRSGGGNRGRGNNRGGQNRRSGSRGGGNRSRSGGGNRSRSRRRPEPKQTGFQKFLSAVTFGLLGKPKHKSRRNSKPKQQEPRKTERQKAADRAAAAPQSSKPRKVNREKVTSGRLYVGNLDYSTNEADLEELFKGAGNVLSAEVVTNARTQQSKGFAFVEMGSIGEAERAVEILDDKDFQGRRLIVSGARSEGPREGDEPGGKDDAPASSSQDDAPNAEEPEESHEGNTSLAETAADYRH